MRLLTGLIWLCSFIYSAAIGQPTPDDQRRSIVQQRLAVAQAAVRFVGIREVGQNRGPVYELFIKPYGYGPGTLYCGLFCHHVFVTAAVSHGVKGPSLAVNWSRRPGVIVWKNNHSVKGRLPLSGDLALYRFGTRHFNHVEIIVNWPIDGMYCWVIGGNTSNPNGPGEGVFLKKRLKAEMTVVSRITFE